MKIFSECIHDFSYIAITQFISLLIYILHVYCYNGLHRYLHKIVRLLVILFSTLFRCAFNTPIRIQGCQSDHELWIWQPIAHSGRLFHRLPLSPLGLYEIWPSSRRLFLLLPQFAFCMFLPNLIIKEFDGHKGYMIYLICAIIN